MTRTTITAALTIAAIAAVCAGCSRTQPASGSDARKDTAAATPMAAAAQSTAVTTSAALDGKTFSGEAIEHGKTAGDKDEMSFNAGRFHSKGCDQYGFGDAPYTAVAAGDAVSFSAETTSPTEGKIVWSGTVKDDAVTGTMLWTKQGQAPITYNVKGALKK
jgi:hypothetical protein